MNNKWALCAALFLIYSGCIAPAQETVIRLADRNTLIQGGGAVFANGSVTINRAGVYRLNGVLNTGQIRINAGRRDTVELILAGVTIQGNANAAIYGEQADKLILTLAEGSVNTLTDASAYRYANAVNEEPDAALFSKNSLTIRGEGSLTINGNFNNGIGTKDNLVIENGIITVNAANHGIRGRDAVTIKTGVFKITAKGDGIQANNGDRNRGWILLEDGNYEIAAQNDGIQAETDLTISGGTYRIVSGGGSGVRLDDDISAKGLKAAGLLRIGGGNFSIDSADDSIHSNARIEISRGDMTIASGDDGIHADEELVISGGAIMVRQSYEGIESPLIRISGGDINLTASNDGLNVAGTGDGRNNRNANNRRQAAPDRRLYISGGTIRIDSGSDGIDINGSGEIYVAASPSGYIGALDYDRSFTISGGILVAAGSSTMSQLPLETSSQPSIMIYYNRDQSAGREVTIKDAQGRQIFAYTPPKAFRSIVISTPALRRDAAYTVSAGNGVTTDINVTGMALVVSEDGQAINQGRGGFGPPRR